MPTIEEKLIALEDAGAKARNHALAACLVFLGIAFLSTFFGALADHGDDLSDEIFGTFFLAAVLVTVAWNGSRAAAIATGLFLLVTAALSFQEGTLLKPGVMPVLYALALLGSIIWSVFLARDFWIYFRFLSATDREPRGSSLVRGGGNLLIWILFFLLVLGFAGSVFGWVDEEETTTTDNILSVAEIEASSVEIDRSLARRLSSLQRAGIINGIDVPRLSYFASKRGVGDTGAIVMGRELITWWPGTRGTVSQTFPVGEICAFTVGAPPRMSTAHTTYVLRDVRDREAISFSIYDRDLDTTNFVDDLKALNDELMHPLVKSACENGDLVPWEQVARDNDMPRNVFFGDPIPDKTREWLESEVHIWVLEPVIGFYSGAKYDANDSGLFFNNNRVAGWWTDRGERKTWSADMGTLCLVTRGKRAHPFSFGRSVLFWRSTDNSVGEFVLPWRAIDDDWMLREIFRLNEAKKTELDDITCRSRSADIRSGALQPD